MATIDRDLVRAINSGQCFALVGAGPSCQIGLPDWALLTEIVLSELDQAKHKAEIERCKKLIKAKDYPATFSAIAKVIGLPALLGRVEKELQAPSRTGHVYKLIADWPFAVYLTTNYDDCLAHHLQVARQSFVTKRNTQDDFRLLRADTHGVIFKVHGDCTTPNDIVLTTEQYTAFRSSPDRHYWREKIRSVLHMVNVVLIGTSASDPDFLDQLQLAKDIASPDHPIFMFATGISSRDVAEYFLEYNIRVIPYKNPDGTHRDLQRLLRRYDPFIAKRGAPHLGQPPIDEERVRTAASLHLYTRLNLLDGQASCLKKSYQALVASILGDCVTGTQLSLEQLSGELAQKLRVTRVDPQVLGGALEELHSRGLIEVLPGKESYRLTPAGFEKLETTKAARQLGADRFSEACRVFIRREFPTLKQDVQETIIEQISRGLIRAFERRGAELAESTFGSSKLDLSTATDILETVNQHCEFISDEDGKAAFADLMIQVLLTPTSEMKEYIGDLSQGFFSYHALGLDPNCSEARLAAARDKSWILDSSIVLPLLAKGCVNHEFALDILKRMVDLGFKICTTARLFEEVIEHADWAIRNFGRVPPNSPKFLQAASGQPGYKQNLFVDGYMKWALLQGAPSMDEYFRSCLGVDYDRDLRSCVAGRIQNFKIDNVEFSDWPDFEQEKWADRERITNEIIAIRQERGTYRTDAQCTAEAEVLILCEEQKAGFLSQSGILDSIDRDRPRITWTPESMYRFLSSFSSSPPSEDLLYQSMVQDFFYSGFDIINTDTLREYFAAPVNQSRMDLDQEKDHYEKVLGSSKYDSLSAGYELVPDVQKPFYSMQFAFFVARKEREGREAAEKRARNAEETKALTEKERQEYNRLKAKEAEKHARGVKKHRKQQSKKKKGKKK